LSFYGFFYAIENLLEYDAMFIGKLLASVTDALEAPASSIFRVVQINLNIEAAGFPGKSVSIDLPALCHIPEFFSSSTVTTLPKYSSVNIFLNSELQLYVS
jgi:hypothetical protein